MDDERYRRRWGAGAEPERRRALRVSWPQRLGLGLLLLAPWLMYAGLVAGAAWFVMFDGDPGTDTLGWVMPALAVQCLLVASRASQRQRRWIRGRFQLELRTRGGPGEGGRLGWFDLLP